VDPPTVQTAIRDPIITLLRERCCVNVRGQCPGAGFFVSTQLVITCAHVVGHVPLRSFVELRQGTKRIRAKLVELLEHENDDLALLEVPRKHAGVPIPLGDVPWMDEPLVAVGFPDSGEDQALDSLSAKYEEQTDIADGRPNVGPRFLYKFKAAHVVSGFSGGPLVSLEQMRAIGVVSHTRSQSEAIGGWAMPVEIAYRLLSINSLAGRSIPTREPIEWLDAVQARARLIAERQKRSESILSGLPSFLPYQTAISNFVASYLGSAQNPEPFGGRDKEVEALDDWVRDDTASPYLIIAAPLGRGKSALLVRWSTRLLEDESESCRVVFVPVSVRYDLNTATAVFSALGARLCAMLAMRNPLPLDASADLWRELVSQLLSKDLPAGVRLVVILDGVDESAGWELGPSTFPTKPATRVKVVLSARDRADRSGMQWLETLNWLDPSIARLMPLVELDRAGTEGVLRTAMPPHLFAANPTLIDELWRLSAGDPLVLNLYAKALRDHRPAIEKPIRIDDLPQIAPGLEGFFVRWWDDQLRLWRGHRSASLERTTYSLFNMLALAFGPLERSDLLNLLRSVSPDASGDDLDQALGALARFVTRDDLRNAYVLGHPRFGAYRLARLKADGDYDRHERTFLEWGRLLTRPPPVGRPASKASRYIVQYYSAHLNRAQAGPEDLLELLSADWRANWQDHADEFGSFDVVLDEVQQRLSRVDRESFKQGGAAMFVGQQLRCALELSEFRDTSRSVAPEMLGSLVKFRLLSLSAAFHHIVKLDNVWERAQCLVNVIPFVPREQLGRVNHLIDELKGEHHDPLGDLLEALCARLCELNSFEAARALVPMAPAGYPRASVLMRLALSSQGKEREEELVAAFSEFEACRPIQRARLVRRYRRDFMSDEVGRSESFAGRVLSSVCKVVEQDIRGDITPENLCAPRSCQYIQYILPFLSIDDRSKYITQYLDRVLATYPKEIGWYVADFFRDNGPLFSSSLLPQSLQVVDSISNVSDRVNSQFDLVATILSLWPKLTTQERRKWETQMIDAVSRFDDWHSINDRADAFGLMGKTGFTATALELIASAPEDDWHTADLIVSLAPYLSEEEARRALALIPGIKVETQERTRRAVLARLASFTAASASDAQRYAHRLDVDLEAHLASNFIEARAKREAGNGHGLLEKLREIEDPIFRFNVLQLCLPVLGPVKGSVAKNLTAFFIDGPKADHRLGVAAFAILAEKIDVRDLGNADLLSLVHRLLRSVPSEEKIELMTPFFVHAARAGFGTEILNLAETAGSATFEIPYIVAIFGIAASGESATLVSWACKRARNLKDQWSRLAAYAALRVYIGDGTLKDAWRETAASLNPLEILVKAREIAGFLRRLPKAERAGYFEQIARHCTFSLDRDSYVETAAIQTLAAVAPLAWLDEWWPKVDDMDSSSKRQALLISFGLRYAELRDYKSALTLMGRVYDTDLASILSRAVPHLDRTARRAALDLMLKRRIPRDQRPLAWAGFNRVWDIIDVGEAFDIADRWLSHVPHQGLGANLLDLCGISGCLQRVAGSDALTVALSITERVLANRHEIRARSS